MSELLQDHPLPDAVQAVWLTVSVFDKFADAFAPLKSVTSPALLIIKLVQDYRSQRREFKEFGQHVEATMVALTAALHSAKSDVRETRKAVKHLEDILVEIYKTLERYNRKRYKFWFWLWDPKFLNEYQKQFDDAIKAFNLDMALSTRIHVKNIERFVGEIDEKLSRDIKKIALGKLPLTSTDAKFVDTEGCLENTRTALLKDILDWIKSGKVSQPAQVRLLADVAGSGKSTVAHTIARMCSETDCLAFNFFFDRKVAGKNICTSIITDMAHHLSTLDPELAYQISKMVDQGLTESLSGQFTSLILKPLQQVKLERPLAIVIDALDEGADAMTVPLYIYYFPITISFPRARAKVIYSENYYYSL
ncbi:hypothetical protein C8J56DRAFT_1028144 [Mycena floridula]|nr:hypothetical protein C8J56DRAFT_1028144 [Mycena floridula]